MRTLFVLAAAVVLVMATTISVAAQKPANSLNGGGQIVDGGNVVSFGGNVKEASNGALSGQLQINFHNVSNGDVSGGRFHTTDITDATWFAADSATCTGAMNVTATGRFNGANGWSVIFRAGDNDDTVRVQLFNPGGVEVYDTRDGDFADESSCVGTARTRLDRGNLRIKLAD